MCGSWGIALVFGGYWAFGLASLKHVFDCIKRIGVKCARPRVDGVKVIFMLLSQTGQLGEELASQYVESVLGWKVIARCARFRVGEIDIVATGGDPILHFIEVKFRNTSTFGDVVESITYKKIERLKRAISEWRREKGDYRSGEIVFIGIQRAGRTGSCARAQGLGCDSFGDGFEVRVERIE